MGAPIHSDTNHTYKHQLAYYRNQSVRTLVICVSTNLLTLDIDMRENQYFLYKLQLVVIRNQPEWRLESCFFVLQHQLKESFKSLFCIPQHQPKGSVNILSLYSLARTGRNFNFISLPLPSTLKSICCDKTRIMMSYDLRFLQFVTLSTYVICFFYNLQLL